MAIGAVLPVAAFPSTPTVCEPYEVVLPLEVTTPLRFALVVTVAALPVIFASSEDVLMAYETPPLAPTRPVKAARVGALVNTCVPAQVLLVVVPNAMLMSGVAPPEERMGYVPVTLVTPPAVEDVATQLMPLVMLFQPRT